MKVKMLWYPWDTGMVSIGWCRKQVRADWNGPELWSYRLMFRHCYKMLAWINQREKWTWWKAQANPTWAKQFIPNVSSSSQCNLDVLKAAVSPSVKEFEQVSLICVHLFINYMYWTINILCYITSLEIKKIHWIQRKTLIFSYLLQCAMPSLCFMGWEPHVGHRSSKLGSVTSSLDTFH